MNAVPSVGVAGDRARLDERLELPRLRPPLPVRLVRVERAAQCARPALRAQVGVGAEHDAVGGRLGSSRAATRAPPLGVGGVAVVHEQHVDVARVVELGAAELAHPDHRHRNRRRGDVERGREAGLRERGELGGRRRAGRRCRAGRAPRCAPAAGASNGAARAAGSSAGDRGCAAPATSSTAPRRDGAVTRSRSIVDASAVAFERRRQRARRDASPRRARRAAAVVGERRRRARVGVEQAGERQLGGRAGSADRSSAAATRRRTVDARSITAECRGVPGPLGTPGQRRILDSCPASASPPPRSTSSSATSTATCDRILDAYDAGRGRRRCDLVVFPELTITGYPPEDLLLRPAFVAAGRPRRSTKVAARTGRLRGGDRLPRAPAATSTTRPRSARTARCTASTASSSCRTTRCSTSSATSRRRPIAGPLFVDRRACRSASRSARTRGARPGRSSTQAAGGAELVVNINASPYYARPARASARRCSPTRAADASVPIVYVNLVGGQDELVFDGASLVFDEQGHLVARAKQFDEDLLVVDLDVRPTFRKRLLDPRGRVSAPPLPEVAVTDARIGAAPTRPRDRAAARAGARGLRGARARHARLRAQERLHRRAHRPLRRHRLVARRRDRGRRARRRARHRRADAVALLERRQHHRRRGARRRTSASARYTDADRAGARGVRRRCSRRCSTGTDAGRSPRRTCRPASAATC